MRNWQMITAAMAVLCTTFWAEGRPAHLYRLHDLGTFGGETDDSYGLRLAEDGTAIGWAQEDGLPLGFRWTPETGLQKIGHLGGGQSEAWGINAAGLITGQAHIDAQVYKPFIWGDGEIRSVGTLGGPYGGGWDVNDLGVVAGWAQTIYANRAFVWVPDEPNTLTGTMEALPELGLSLDTTQQRSAAYAINNFGQLAGRSRADNRVGHLVLWQPAEPPETGYTLIDIGHLGGYSSNEFRGLNEAGWAVGWSTQEDGNRVAVLWRPDVPNGTTGELINLGRITEGEARATGVNEYGVITGQSQPIGFVWDERNGMRDVNTLLDDTGAGWTVEYVRDVNNAGWLIGVATHESGRRRAVVLEPRFTDVSGDGAIDAVDLQAVINAVLGAIEWHTHHDVDGSGAPNAIDIQKVVNEILGG